MEKKNSLSGKKIVGLVMLILFVLAFIFSCLCKVLNIGRILVGTFGYFVFPLTVALSLVSLAMFLGLSYRRSLKSTAYFVLSAIFLMLAIESIVHYSALKTVVDGASLKALLMSNYSHFTLFGSFGDIFSGVIADLIGAMGTIVAYVVLTTVFVGLFVDYQIYGKYEEPHIKKLKSKKLKDKVSSSDRELVRSSVPNYSFESEGEQGNDEVLGEITAGDSFYGDEAEPDYSEDEVVGEVTAQDYSEQYGTGEQYSDAPLTEQTANTFSGSNIQASESPYPDVYSYDPTEDRRRFMNATFGVDTTKSETSYSGSSYNYDRQPDYSEPLANLQVEESALRHNQAENFEQSEGEANSLQSAAASDFAFENSSAINNSDMDEISKILSKSDDDIEEDLKSDIGSTPLDFSSSNLGFASELKAEEPKAEPTDFDKRSNFSSNPQTPNYVGGFGQPQNTNFGQPQNTGFSQPQNNDFNQRPQSVGFGVAQNSNVGFSNPQPSQNNGQFKQGTSDSEPKGFSQSQYVVPSSSAQKEPSSITTARKSFNMGISGIRYNPPPLSLLATPKKDTGDYTEEQERKSSHLEKVLAAFNIPAKVKNIVRGPKITRYELSVPLGISVKRIPMIENDIAAALAAKTITIKAPIPGSSYVGIELENDTFTTVYERELLESPEFQNFKDPLPIAIGKDISGEIVVKSLAKMVHLLIAGSTGSGKSVFIHNIVLSLIYKLSPDELRLIMIDPKKVEFNRYNGLPHLLTPEVVMGADKAINALKWSVKEMDRRYSLMSQAGFNNIEPYNRSELVKAGQFEKFPYIVIIVDELAEIMQVNKKEVDACIQRITQLARACGMHMILATQRPSVDIISGVIKNNVPSRIAFSLQSGIDSKTILNSVGAEKLLGQGDMIFAPTGTSATPRLQASYASDDEIKAVIDYTIKYNQASYDESVENIINSDDPYASESSGGGSSADSANKEGTDDYFKTAVKFVMQNGGASVSYLQRKLSIGYSRAARIVDQMEEKGYIGGATGAKLRKVLITPEQFKQDFGEDFDSID